MEAPYVYEEKAGVKAFLISKVFPGLAGIRIYLSRI
jgi:hypothetical protein